MRAYLFTLLIITGPLKFCAAQKRSAYDTTLSFIKEKDYFRARDHFKLHADKMMVKEKLVIEAYVANAFNRPDYSNVAISAFFKGYARNAGDSLKLELLRLKQNNHGRLFEYADALTVNREILSKYSYLLHKEEITDYQNTAVIWKALIACPKQQIIIKGKTVMRMKRDKANLANLEVKANGATSNFIFDTGANLSTVSESTANAFHMTILKGTIEVGSVTGANVHSRLAICPQLSIGKITVKNAVFLVFPDTALAFKKIKYQINGIIGFPVIEYFKEVQLTRGDDFIVPMVQSSGTVQNLALDFLTPIIDLQGEYFTFDTGATGSILYSKYLTKHQSEISRKYAETNLKFGGAGGMTTKKGYKITFSPVINGKKLKLKKVNLFRENIEKDNDPFYGNIGQDVIKKFNKMTLNFSSMFIRFE